MRISDWSSDVCSSDLPATKRILAVALLASMIIAAILAFAAESVDSRVRTSEQVERLTGTPALATVPEIPDSWTDLAPSVAVIDRHCSALSEDMRSLMFELALQPRAENVEPIVCQSPTLTSY